MKADKYALISKYVLVALMLASVAVFALFFFGEAKVLEVPAEMRENMAGDLTYPAYTDLLLYACYGIFVLALAVTVILGLVSFAKRIVQDPKDTIQGMLPMALVCVLTVVAIAISASNVDAILVIQYMLFAICLFASLIGLCNIKRNIGKK
jgi:hypothetical protein